MLLEITELHSRVLPPISPVAYDLLPLIRYHARLSTKREFSSGQPSTTIFFMLVIASSCGLMRVHSALSNPHFFKNGDVSIPSRYEKQTPRKIPNENQWVARGLRWQDRRRARFSEWLVIVMNWMRF